MELVCRGKECRLGQEPVGVIGGEGGMLRQRSSSESPRPRTFLFDLWITKQDSVSNEHEPLQENKLVWHFIIFKSMKDCDLFGGISERTCASVS